MHDNYRIVMPARLSAQLEKISDHIAQFSVKGATRQIQRILNSIESLAIFPQRQVVRGQEKATTPVRSLPG